jgi:hypothetical protein
MMRTALFSAPVAVVGLIAAVACSAPAAGGPDGASGGAPAAGGNPGLGGGPGLGGMPGVGGNAAVTPIPVEPVFNGTRYAFSFGETLFEVDPNVGARITTLSLGGMNLLTGPEVDASNYGATFWPSPQSGWNSSGWPPPPEIDNGPYTASADATMVTMVGSANQNVGVAVTKQFLADAATGVITVGYNIYNASSGPVSVAPWEIARVAARGLVFFPVGALTSPGSSLTPLPMQTGPQAIWLDYATAGVGGGEYKSFADGGPGGWLAYLDGDLLFLRSFPDIPVSSHAPGQGEIEIYTNGQYLELEIQGAYQSIPVGGNVQWVVFWRVVRVPPAVPRTAGSAELVAYVQSLVR